MAGTRNKNNYCVEFHAPIPEFPSHDIIADTQRINMIIEVIFYGTC